MFNREKETEFIKVCKMIEKAIDNNLDYIYYSDILRLFPETIKKLEQIGCECEEFLENFPCTYLIKFENNKYSTEKHPNAKDMREYTGIREKVINEKVFNHIFSKIREAAAVGCYDVTVDDALTDEMKKKLSELGYSYGVYKKNKIKISWSET